MHYHRRLDIISMAISSSYRPRWIIE